MNGAPASNAAWELAWLTIMSRVVHVCDVPLLADCAPGVLRLGHWVIKAMYILYVRTGGGGGDHVMEDAERDPSEASEEKHHFCLAFACSRLKRCEWGYNTSARTHLVESRMRPPGIVTGTSYLSTSTRMTHHHLLQPACGSAPWTRVSERSSACRRPAGAQAPLPPPCS